MSMLDDTNVYYRRGEEGARMVKEEANRLLNVGGKKGELGSMQQSCGDEGRRNHVLQSLESLNKKFIAENISPGGSADMLSLTRLVQSLIES